MLERNLVSGGYNALKMVVKVSFLIAIIVTGLVGLLYVTVQQDLRQGANDPQIQMAEDIAAKLAGGQQVQSVVPSEKVNIASSKRQRMIDFSGHKDLTFLGLRAILVKP
jgi:hypothetical protein